MSMFSKKKCLCNCHFSDYLPDCDYIFARGALKTTGGNTYVVLYHVFSVELELGHKRKVGLAGLGTWWCAKGWPK